MSDVDHVDPYQKPEPRGVGVKPQESKENKMAYKIGSGWFEISSDQEVDGKEIEELQEKLDMGITTTLMQFQTIIKTLVNIRDTRRLTHLQTCVGELFKSASDTMADGRYYVINDEVADAE